MPLDRHIKPPMGPDPVFTFPSIERCLLTDQLHAWTVHRTDVPVVALAVMVPGGSAGDDPGSASSGLPRGTTLSAT